MKKLSIADIWEVCVEMMWASGYTASLAQLLRSHNTSTVLDCAGGIGFPSIALRQAGWDVTYSDGSPVMYRRFLERLATSGVTLPHYQANWLQLCRVVPGNFSAVLCRGNSLPWVDSWGKRRMSARGSPNVLRALRQFHSILSAGGLLYADLAGAHEYNQPAYPLVTEYAETQLQEYRAGLCWEISHDNRRQIRTWSGRLLLDGRSYPFRYQCHLIYYDELLQLLQQAGFINAQMIQLPGEHHYQPFLAFKP